MKTKRTGAVSGAMIDKAIPINTPGPTGCRCGKTRPWGYTCGSCGVTINEAWVTKVQGEQEAKDYKSLHDAAPELLEALIADSKHVHTAFECGEDRSACPVEAFKRAAIAKAEGK